MPTKPMLIAIYLRKSRKDVEAEREAAKRGEAYDTLSKHRAELFSYASREGFEVIDVFEEVVSGEFIQERPAMQVLLQNVKALVYDAVLVADLDRLGRGDKRDQGWIEKIFKDSHTLILTPFETLDLNQDLGEFTVEVKSFLARMEYKQIKKRLLAGRRRAVMEGKDLSQKPPYGYVKDATLRLQVNTAEADIVKRIFDWYIAGIGQMRIAEMLTESGIPSPSGKPVWSRVTIGKILANPKYKGDQVFGRVRWIKQEDGSYLTRKARAQEEVYTKIAAHAAIVSADTWGLAQKIMVQKRTWCGNHKRSQINPFAGVLICGACGRAMQAHYPKNRPGPYVRCQTSHCPQRMIALSRIEEVVNAKIRPLMECLSLSEMIKKRSERPAFASHPIRRNSHRPLPYHAWEVYASANVEQKNRIIKALIKHIVYCRKKEWTAPWNFSLEIELLEGM